MLAVMKRTMARAMGLLGGIALSSATLGCDEKKVEPVTEQPPAPEPEPEPVVESPPHLVISAEGPTVRGASIEGGKKSGVLAAPELAQLERYLGDEKKFIEGQDVNLVVAREAKRGWVSAYIDALGKLGVGKITVLTETRAEFQGKLEFLPSTAGKSLEGCTMIGQVTKHNGSALWQIKGGTAGERGPGLGGPDLSMAKEVIAKNYEKCESNVFLTDGEVTKDWGFIFDMAAAAASTEGAGVTKALLPSAPATAGRPVQF